MKSSERLTNIAIVHSKQWIGVKIDKNEIIGNHDATFSHPYSVYFGETKVEPIYNSLNIQQLFIWFMVAKQFDMHD